MRTLVRPLLLLAAALVAAGALGACGANKAEEITQGESEGNYLDLGELKYQVQISRQLNVTDTEDRPYLQGFPPEELRVGPDETLFAVFLRVINESGRPHHAAEEFEIEDTQGRRFEPIEGGRGNTFVYRPAQVPPHGALPEQGSIGDAGPVGGAMLLFKLDLAALANRPIELRIANPGAHPPEAVVDLDV